jgi:hypothetical protein
MQQNVDGPTGLAMPIGSPPLGWQVPASYAGAVADLLPSAEPAGTSWQLDAEAVTVAATSCVEHASSVKIVTCVEHVLPDTGPHVQAEHVLVSSKPS